MSQNLQQPMGDDRVGLALHLQRREALAAHGALDETLRRLADQHGAGLGGLLEPGREVGRVAHRGVVHAEVVADAPHDDEPAVEPHAHHELGREAGPGARLVQAAQDAERGQHRAAGVILVRDGRAEQRHEAVAEELVDRAFVVVDLGEGQLEEALEQTVHRLRPQPRGQLRRIGDVAKQHGHLLALALQRALRGEDLLGEVSGRVALGRGEPRRLSPGGRGGGDDGERPTALLAKFVARGVLDAAVRTARRQARAALRTKLGVGRSVVAALRALHGSYPARVKPAALSPGSSPRSHPRPCHRGVNVCGRSRPAPRPGPG